MLATASLPENSKASAGSSEMMSSICLAMTTVSFGVCAKAGGLASARPAVKVSKRRRVRAAESDSPGFIRSSSFIASMRDLRPSLHVLFGFVLDRAFIALGDEEQLISRRRLA